MTRRQVLAGTAGAGAAMLAGCSGDDSTSDPSEDGDSGSGGGNETPTTTAGPGSGPDPNCGRLAGSPTEYDAAGTPFVFTFDYVDTWTVQEPLEGPGGRSQGITSPRVTVDGEIENAGVRVGQRFEPLTATAVDEQIADATSGQYNPTEVLGEQEYDGETVRIVGIAEAESLPIYRLWLPHGPAGDRLYYPVEIDVLTSILRVGDDGTALLCLEETLTATETVRESLRPNPDTTIDSV